MDYIALDNLYSFYQPKGILVVVVDNKIYNVTDLVNTHSGGKNAMMLYLYRDATSYFHSFHSKSSFEILTQYLIGFII